MKARGQQAGRNPEEKDLALAVVMEASVCVCVCVGGGGGGGGVRGKGLYIYSTIFTPFGSDFGNGKHNFKFGQQSHWYVCTHTQSIIQTVLFTFCLTF